MYSRPTLSSEFGEVPDGRSFDAMLSPRIREVTALPD